MNGKYETKHDIKPEINVFEIFVLLLSAQPITNKREVRKLCLKIDYLRFNY